MGDARPAPDGAVSAPPDDLRSYVPFGVTLEEALEVESPVAPYREPARRPPTYRLSLRWRHPQRVPLTLFVAFWGAGAAVGALTMAIEGKLGPLLFMLSHVGAAVWLTRRIIAAWRNRTTVTLGRTLDAVHAPVPWGALAPVDEARVRRFEVDADIDWFGFKTCFEDQRVFAVRARLDDGSVAVVVPELRSETQARALAELLHRCLTRRRAAA